jgi:hypothetical protein
MQMKSTVTMVDGGEAGLKNFFGLLLRNALERP